MLNIQPVQHPSCNTRLVRYAGDILRISLTLNCSCAGKAWLRTNLGCGAIHRQEIVDHYEKGSAMMGRDWTDLAMRQSGEGTYEIALPLNEVGVFEFKAFFVNEDESSSYWPNGANCHVKVEPANTYACNTIYNAFIRQYGPNLTGNQWNEELRSACETLDNADFTVIPPSGKFRDFAKHLNFILDDLGFKIIQFLPVHPAPATFARMGRFGSPFAPLDFYSVDSSLAEFDRKTAPLEQFEELIDQVHGHGGLVFIDIPINHTGWASAMQNHHPDWFARNPDGSFASPSAWGVVWADLCALDFSKDTLKFYLADMFLHWCRNGVDGFRCDAGYMIPAPIWTYIIHRVRQEYPDTIFFLEGLGGGIDATTRLLNESGMNWAYSELFQNYDVAQISGYSEHAATYSQSNGALVNFAETHDNMRLAAKGERWAALRVALSALFSPAGCFGIANGVEWLATEKIDVHGAPSLNWGNSKNLVPLLRKLMRLLAIHPAFHGDAVIRPPVGSGGTANGLIRIPKRQRNNPLLAVVNPNINAPATYEWNYQDFEIEDKPVDILTGKAIPVKTNQCQVKIILAPGQFLCLARSRSLADDIIKELNDPSPIQLKRIPLSIRRQQLKAVVLSFIVARNGYGDLKDIDLESYADALYHNPLALLAKLNGDDRYLPVVEWYPNKDERRIVPLPPAHHLLINHSKRFIAQLMLNGKCIQRSTSLLREDGRYFALFRPLKNVKVETPLSLMLSFFDEAGKVSRITAPILQIPDMKFQSVSYILKHSEIQERNCALATTDLGGYGLVRAAWGRLDSQYDAFLAANLNDAMPVDRTVVLPRFRIQLNYRGYKHELGFANQQDFAVTGPNAFQWRFVVPTGMGGNAFMAVNYVLDSHANKFKLIITRCAMPQDSGELNGLDANSPITLTIRPDVDDRSYHTNTTAYPNAEREFPGRITAYNNGFTFALSNGARLETRAANALYTQAPEWQYCVHHRLESERGLRDCGDLFNPGYFKAQLQRHDSVILEAQVFMPNVKESPSVPTCSLPADFSGFAPLKYTFKEALDFAMNAFIVRRNEYGSVIAGYPWFLDWGRDTLICLRGMIASGRMEQAMATIRQFASYEENGTLPNMISGQNVSNRDTSDAPLMLFVTVNDYLEKAGESKQSEVLQISCGQRTLLEVLESIAANYQKGTKNGICMDKSSGLIFSPAHYTWMDTNYPAATPREGYPVELQAMWHLALQMLHKFTAKTAYAELAQKVRASFMKLYPAGKYVGLSDCLHAQRGQSAFDAIADDAARPNQLMAINLGLVDDAELKRHILQACSSLVVPGAMRTLADQPVTYRQPVYAKGLLLNDPAHPFWGNYCGDEDTRRKPAYHNGTAWGMMLPPFCEALYRTYGKAAAQGAAALLGTGATIMRQGCLGQLPEIVDGNFPHTIRGCCAQAWSITEFRRVLELIM